MLFRVRDGIVALADGLEVVGLGHGRYEWRSNDAIKIHATDGSWPIVHCAVGLAAIGRPGVEVDILELTTEHLTSTTGAADRQRTVKVRHVGFPLRGLRDEIDARLAGAGVGDSLIVVHAAWWSPAGHVSEANLRVDEWLVLPAAPGETGPDAIPDEGQHHSASSESSPNNLEESGFCAFPESSPVWEALLPLIDDWARLIDEGVSDDQRLASTFKLRDMTMVDAAAELEAFLEELVANMTDVFDQACVGGRWRFILVPRDGGPADSYYRDLGPSGVAGQRYRPSPPPG